MDDLLSIESNDGGGALMMSDNVLQWPGEGMQAIMIYDLLDGH